MNGRPGVAFVVWALLLGVLAAVLWAVFEEEDLLSVLMPAFAVGLTIALALGGWRAAARAARRAFEPQPNPDTSWSAALLGVAVAVVLVGLEVGTFLVFIGAGLLAFALGGLVREWRAERRPG
jgi:chromate transport protein ChrA